MTGKVIEHLATAKNPAVVAGAEGDIWASMYEGAAVWRIHASSRGVEMGRLWCQTPKGAQRATSDALARRVGASARGFAAPRCRTPFRLCADSVPEV